MRLYKYCYSIWMGILNIRCTPPINQELEMTTVFGELDHVLLMAPGPSPVAPNVLKAMSLSLIHI